jgi:hypothetical protein
MTDKCCVCGSKAKGKQRHNRDKGFWICSKCAKEEQQELSEEEMLSNYGVEWVNFYINK